MSKYSVLFADFIFSDNDFEERRLSKIDAEAHFSPSSDENTLIHLVSDVDAIVVTYAEITANIIKAAKKCKVIIRTGIGLNNIDIVEASKQNIMVANVPDYCIHEVADHTLALILTCLRKTAFLSKKVREGAWGVDLAKPISRLNSLTLGLLGFGRIARSVCVRAKAFGMNVIAYDPYIDDSCLAEHEVRNIQSVEELVQDSDVLSLHAPLNKQTHHIINSDTFLHMKENSVLINTSRGPLVNENDLCVALEKKLIAGCGIDVFEDESTASKSRLLDFDNVVVTPHTAFYSEESEIELREKALEQVIQVLSGKTPTYWVNKAL
jgi:D-3-phosphoglycerate dehydrogenase / 2-oxoglutarate reductase